MGECYRRVRRVLVSHFRSFAFLTSASSQLPVYRLSLFSHFRSRFHLSCALSVSTAFSGLPSLLVFTLQVVHHSTSHSSSSLSVCRLSSFSHFRSRCTTFGLLHLRSAASHCFHALGLVHGSSLFFLFSVFPFTFGLPLLLVFTVQVTLTLRSTRPNYTSVFGLPLLPCFHYLGLHTLQLLWFNSSHVYLSSVFTLQVVSISLRNLLPRFLLTLGLPFLPVFTLQVSFITLCFPCTSSLQVCHRPVFYALGHPPSQQTSCSLFLHVSVCTFFPGFTLQDIHRNFIPNLFCSPVVCQFLLVFILQVATYPLLRSRTLSHPLSVCCLLVFSLFRSASSQTSSSLV